MIRPVDAELSQRYGDNPTKNLPATDWLIQTFGNYQPDGHSGEDYACPVGTPVRAVTDGTVLHIGWMGGTYADNPWWIAPNFAGYVAVIDHGAFIGIYGHCQDGSAKVRVGQQVSEGQVFILSGNTGGSTGPHLHFEILPDRYVLNSTMYGRTDPEALFTGSLSYASESITPVTLEDDMFNDEDRKVLGAALDNANRAREVAQATEDRGDSAKIALIFQMLSQIAPQFRFFKGPDPSDDTLYELENGKLRGISLAEWQAKGGTAPAQLNQEDLDKLKG